MQAEIEPEGIPRDVERPFASLGGKCGNDVASITSTITFLLNIFSQKSSAFA